MKWLVFVAASVLACSWVSAQEKAAPIEKVVQIEFPKGGYTFTREQAAKGVQLEYTIRVGHDLPGVIALPTGPSFHEPAGPSGLHPHESIRGNGQIYSLLDFGLAPPPKEVAKTLKKGTYTHVFDWDGRNWTGPSDFNNSKGKPFPAGTYEVMVVARGKRLTENGAEPYQITGKVKLVLK